jgi:hypothetical protein
VLQLPEPSAIHHHSLTFRCSSVELYTPSNALFSCLYLIPQRLNVRADLLFVLLHFCTISCSLASSLSFST